jgi:hypothetical protein
MAILKARWMAPCPAVVDLTAGLLGSFLVLNLNSYQDVQYLAINAGAVLVARMMVQLLELYALGPLGSLVQLALGIAIWAALHAAANPYYSQDLLKRLLPGTIISMLAIGRALGCGM